MNGTPLRFHGWKEIAIHFNRSVRCVQRWERAENLPVHRHAHARGNSIFAFREELDAWQNMERALEKTSAPPPEKENILKTRNAPAGHKIRRSQNHILNENPSGTNLTWSAADLQNFAHQLALLFLRTVENRHFDFTSADRASPISAAARIQNRSV
jgi:hypothetical protein